MLEGEYVLIDGAITVARELGGEIDAEAVLLGALRDEDGPGRRALATCGVTLPDLEARREVPTEEPSGVVATEAQVIAAAAAGHALAAGRTRPTADDVLVVVLWGDPTSALRRWLEDAGVTAELVADALADAGISLPTVPLPRWVEVDAGPRVVFAAEHLGRVLEHAGARLGAAYSWGWNLEETDRSRAWVQGEAAADLPTLVGEVLDAGAFEVQPVDWATERVDARLVEARA